MRAHLLAFQTMGKFVFQSMKLTPETETSLKALLREDKSTLLKADKLKCCQD